MNKNLKGLLAILLVGGVAYLAYTKLYNKKNRFAKMIIKSENASNMATLITFDEGFLKEWAKASRKQLPTFSYQGKTYNTKGGKATN